MMSKAGKKKLLIVPSVPIWSIDGELYFDRKFYDGILSYCKQWPGIVQLAMRPAETSPPEFGLVLYDTNTFPAELVIIRQDEHLSSQDIKYANIVLASGDNHKNLYISALTRKLGIKCVYIIEYIVATRLQIIGMSDLSYWQKIKSSVWTGLTEVRRWKAFRLAEGIQGNGAPAYDKYKKLVDNALLYFDSRNSAESNITDAELKQRLLYLDVNKPLRLGFSGRLIRMKGVDHLIEMARILKNKSVPFTLDIFGAGELASYLDEKVNKYQLDDVVNLRGNVDFSEELIPFIKEKLDLFVCCHRQSDPSCTYLETYACGVPIVGYANQAHQGILEKVDVGWSVAMNDVKALAGKVTYLNQNRSEIKRKAINARLFSAEHTFEQTFSQRIEQCKTLVGDG